MVELQKNLLRNSCFLKVLQKKFLVKLIYEYLQLKKHKISNVKNHLKIFTKTKKVWCASSTHHNEEHMCGIIHKKLKKKYKNLLTIIITRHIERVDSIKKNLERIGLKIHVHEPQKKININTDIYLVNVYGQTK